MGTRLSLDNIQAGMCRIDPVFLRTPQFMSDSLSKDLNVRLVVKNETINPIGCFKGRGAELFISALAKDTPSLVSASAGNFGQALIYAARKKAIPVVIFAPESANALKIERMRALGGTVVLSGSDFDAAKLAALEYAESHGARFVEDGREPAISEGAGTIAIELCQWPGGLEVVLLPLGGGALVAGVGLWFKAYSPSTRIIGVCAKGAPAMALSRKAGTVQQTQSVSTIADGIAIRVPVEEAVRDVSAVADDIILVDDDALLEAMRLVFRHHRWIVEPSGVAGVAAVISHQGQFRDAVVATPLCGGNVTLEQTQSWLLSPLVPDVSD